MDPPGAYTGQLTQPIQAEKKRFHLEWHLPLEPGLPTHAALFDLEHDPACIVAEDLGGDEVETLQNLSTTLTAHQETADAAAYVADAYSRRTGRHPERRGADAV